MGLKFDYKAPFYTFSLGGNDGKSRIFIIDLLLDALNCLRDV